MSEMDCGYRNWDRGNHMPAGLKDWYENLRVQFHDGTSTHVRIQRYRSEHSSEPVHSAHVADGEKSRIFQAIRRRAGVNNNINQMRVEYSNAPAGVPPFEDVDLVERVRVFLGWGDPIEIAQVLRLAVWSGALTATGLPFFCDQYIGVDCAGFAGNYYGGRLRGTKPVNFASPHRLVRRLDQVRQGDAIVWQGGERTHVAVIDFLDPSGPTAGPPPRLRCWVAESTGSQLGASLDSRGGLSYTDYILTQGTDTVLVSRPTPVHHECEENTYARSPNAAVYEAP